MLLAWFLFGEANCCTDALEKSTGMVNDDIAVLALRVVARLSLKGLALARHVEVEDQPFTTSQRFVGEFAPSPARYKL